MTDFEQRLSPAARRARAADALELGSLQALDTRPGLSIPKLITGIPGFDAITMGGVPQRRATVLAGQAGSGKTIFAAHFLAEGVRLGQPGVLVTLEEPAADLRANLATLGWDIAAWEASRDFEIVDASPLIRDDGDVPSYSFETLAAQIGHAVDGTGADRLVIDSLNTVLGFEANPSLARQRLRRLIASLRTMGLTVLMTVETPGDPGVSLSRHGVEEFVADSVILLRHIHEGTVRRRSVEVLKMRGAMHRKGEYGFTVLPGQGVVVLPQAIISTNDAAQPQRITTGNAGLDEMSHGGFFQDSTVLVSGPTGTGKTILSTQFLAGGAAAGERSLLLAYEQSAGEILRNAAAVGIDLVPHLDAGLLQIVALYPEVASLDDHLVEMMEAVDAFSPTRLVIDSLSSLERVGSPETYRRFVTGLTGFVKQEQIAALMTLSSSSLLGAPSGSEGEIFTMTDALVLLRYFESAGRVQRAMTLVKLRGTSHDLDVRSYDIGSGGLVLGQPLGLAEQTGIVR